MNEGKGMFKECEKPASRKRKRSGPSIDAKGRKKEALDPVLSENEAVEEAKRCLGLRGCESCDICSFLCPELCITRNQKTGEVEIDLDYCKGCGICASVCPRGAIEMVMENEG